MKRLVIAAIATLFLASPLAAQAESQGMIVKQSAFGVTKTIDRLGIIMQRKGITIFARVNHGKGAKKVGKDIGEVELLIFGTPKMGTPLMASNRGIGIDLPLKALAWKDADGKVWLGYNDPKHLATRHGIADRDKVFKKMAGALDKFSHIAVTKGALKPAAN